MKKKYVLFLAACGIASLTLSSYDSNLYSHVGNRTGSTGSNTGCATCHGSSASSSTSVTVDMLQNGSTVTTYTPGQTYQVKISGTNTGSSHPKFGFQATVVETSNTSTAAGTLNTGSNSNLVLRASNTIIEHSTPLAALTSGTSNTYEVIFNWVAPSAGTGTVRIYAVLNAVNGNGNDDNGDQFNFGISADIAESTTGIANTILNGSVSIYPNPAVQYATLNLKDFAMGAYTLSVTNLMGAVLSQEIINVRSNDEMHMIDMSNWSNGMYYVTLVKDGATKTIGLMKQ